MEEQTNISNVVYIYIQHLSGCLYRRIYGARLSEALYRDVNAPKKDRNASYKSKACCKMAVHNVY